MRISSLIVMFCWCGSHLSNIEVKKGEKKNNTVEPVLVLLLVPTPKSDHYRQVAVTKLWIGLIFTFLTLD